MNIKQLNSNIALPSYNRSALKAKIIHLGLGAFHRGHQAFLHHQLLTQSPVSDWGICAINLSGGLTIIQDLAKQEHLYTVVEKTDQSNIANQDSANRVTIVGSIIDSMHPDQDGILAIIDKLCEPQVEIITLTITEKGYCTTPSFLDIDINNPLVIDDLANLKSPKSTPAILYAALRKRMELGLKGITLLSCDNIPENGLTLKNAVLGFARLVDKNVMNWIETHITFPSSMVDRIVPAVTQETLDDIHTIIGTEDPCGITTEHFIQWVIEDNFAQNRPNWETIQGVQLVKNVVPFEEMKIRMLNGSHSFLAYLGYLGGYEYISDCMMDPDYKKACTHLMLQEQAITLNVNDIDLDHYAQTLIQRFENTSLKHKTWQIAMDGTQKIPQRFLASIRWHIDKQQDYSLLALGVAAWIRYVSGIDDLGNLIDVKDPMSALLKETTANAQDGKNRVIALLNLNIIFGAKLPQNIAFVEKVSVAYQSLMTIGAKKTLSQYVNQIKTK